MEAFLEADSAKKSLVGKTTREAIDAIPKTDNNAALLEIANRIVSELQSEIALVNSQDELLKYLLRKLRVAALTEDYVNLEKLAKVYVYVCFCLYPSLRDANLRDSYFATAMTARNPIKTKEILSNSLGERLNVPYQDSSFPQLVEDYNTLTEKHYQPLFDFVVTSYNNSNFETPKSFASCPDNLYKTEQARNELAIIVNTVSCEQEESVSWAPLTAFLLKKLLLIWTRG